MKTTKAYRNAKFLMGEDARPVRIVCEYLEPQARFRRLGINRAIIFFGSARTRARAARKSDYYAMAADLAQRLATWTVETHGKAERFYICTGGGPGIMEAVHKGAARVDRRLNVGLNISLPFEQHVNPYVVPDHAFEFHYFFMRKFWFKNLASAIVIFPGGFGTMDELFEMLTLIQTGKSQPMPIVLFGRRFWERTVNFRALADGGLISPEDLNLFYCADTVGDAYRYLTRELSAS